MEFSTEFSTETTGSSLLIHQDYAAYTPEAFAVWRILFERQMDILTQRAHPSFLQGLEKIGFEAGRIPHFGEVNQHLAQLTGFQIVAVPGIVPDDFFFELLATRRFPATTWLRRMDQLDYLEEPDMFHDVFGHIPLLTEPAYCDFLVGLGEMALRHLDNAEAIHLLSRMYWYTIEFGLMGSPSGPWHIYGAGILSSGGESVYSLEEDLPRHPFAVGPILDTPYIKEKYQEVYFLLDSYDTLYHSLGELERELKGRL